jgi:membrane associated rhomboid family serine protease
LANCRKCGAGLPSFSFGELSDLCRDCQSSEPALGKKKTYVLDAIPSLYEHKNKWLTGTNILLAINFGLFAAMTVTGVSPGLPTSADLLRWGADYGPDTLGGQYWRLVTSCFVHIGLVHLAVNMYSLRLLGKAAEKLFRPAEIIAVYLLTGVGGSILTESTTWRIWVGWSPD